MKLKFVTSTIFKEMLIAALNLSVALFLARQFQPLLFLNFTTIMLIVSSVTQLNRGIQFSVVSERLDSLIDVKKRSYTLFTITIAQVCIWVSLTPLISNWFDLPLAPIVIAAVSFPTTVISALVAGELQLSEKFESWQTWLVITSFFQLPFVTFGVLYGANLSYFVLTAFSPMFVSSCLLHHKLRGKYRGVRIFISNSFSKGLYITLLFLNYNLVILVLKFVVTSSDLGMYSLITFPLGAIVGVSSIFGSYKLTDSLKNRGNNDTTVQLKALALILAFMHFAGLSIYLLGPVVFPVFLGSNYGTDFLFIDTFAAATAYSVWGFAYWLTQSQLHKIRFPIVFIQALILTSEFMIILSIELTPTAMFALHGIFGALVTLLLLKGIYGFGFIGHIRRIKIVHT